MLTTEQEKEVDEMMEEIDLSLLDLMLSLTHLERLRVAERYAETFWSVQDASQNNRLPENAQSAVKPRS